MGALADYLAAKSQTKPNLTQANILPSGDGPSELEKQYPHVAGLLNGLMGTGPEEVGGSVLDGSHQAMKEGANWGFPVGLAAQALPLVGPALKWAGAGEKTNAALRGYMEATGMQPGVMPRSRGISVPAIPGFTQDDVAAGALADARDTMVNGFGTKKATEAALAKRVTALANQAPTAATNAPAAVRSKTAPDYFRTMADQQGDQAVMDAVNNGAHLKPDGSGGYVGAPRTVTNRQALGAMRTRMDGDLNSAAQAVETADPNRVGTWYPRAKESLAQSNEPWQLDRSLDQHATYSAGVSPESETGFALKHSNSRALGDPVMAYRSAPMNNLDRAQAAGVDTPMGFKVGEYEDKLDPRLESGGLFGVNDFRRGQGMGFTHPDGKPWKGGVTGTMHPFMDGETALQVQRANADATGGITDWNGPMAQEVPWVYGKGQDLYGRGLKGRFAGDPADGITAALKEANNTQQDYFYKHAASGTYEYTPGNSTGHVPSVLGMTPEEKVAYGESGRWDAPTPYTLADHPEVGAGNRDLLYSAAGLRQLPSISAPGLYTNGAGFVEHNPAMIARPLVDYPTGGKGQVAPATDQALSAIEQFRAVMDAQEAGAWNMPNTMKASKGTNGVVLDTRGSMPYGAADPAQGLMATPDQLSDLSEWFKGVHKDIVVAPTSRGVTAFGPTDESAGALSKSMRKDSDWPAAMLSSNISKARVNSGYVPGIGKFDADYNLAPTTPYSGEATSGLLDTLSQTNPTLTQNLSESEGVRAAINAKIKRDAALPNARGDIQNTRDLFANGDWAKVVDTIRKGATPAAALGAMGYSLNSMAAEPDAPNDPSPGPTQP